MLIRTFRMKDSGLLFDFVDKPRDAVHEYYITREMLDRITETVKKMGGGQISTGFFNRLVALRMIGSRKKRKKKK